MAGPGSMSRPSTTRVPSGPSATCSTCGRARTETTRPGAPSRRAAARTRQASRPSRTKIDSRDAASSATAGGTRSPSASTTPSHTPRQELSGQGRVRSRTASRSSSGARSTRRSSPESRSRRTSAAPEAWGPSPDRRRRARPVRRTRAIVGRPGVVPAIWASFAVRSLVTSLGQRGSVAAPPRGGVPPGGRGPSSVAGAGPAVGEVPAAEGREEAPVVARRVQGHGQHPVGAAAADLAVGPDRAEALEVAAAGPDDELADPAAPGRPRRRRSAGRSARRHGRGR